MRKMVRLKEDVGYRDASRHHQHTNESATILIEDEDAKTLKTHLKQSERQRNSAAIVTPRKNICDYHHHPENNVQLIPNVFQTIYTCLIHLTSSIHHETTRILIILIVIIGTANAYSNGLDKSEQLFDKLNLEQSIAAVFNKVAYGSTTKRSIPDNAYPLTTLATPLLTTFRYSDGSDEWYRVDVQKPDFETEYDEKKPVDVYGSDLEKDHILPTSAPAADILKNNNNKNYMNPNRYNNDRLRPDYSDDYQDYKTTTNGNLPRNARPTKSMYSKTIPSYVPPSRALFTPPLPPQYQNPFADKPTLRGTNSDSFANRRPLPPPSLMPNKDRIPFRPDLPPTKVNSEKVATASLDKNPDRYIDNKKKSLNTPSQNVKLGDFYGLKSTNDSQFEYEKSYAPEPSITRILSGSNGRHDDIQIPDILYRTVTAMPKLEVKKPRTPVLLPPEPEFVEVKSEEAITEMASLPPPLESVIKHNHSTVTEITTQMSDVVNLPNVKKRDSNVTKATSEEIWLICWNVHVYLVVFGYIILAVYSIYKLIRYENDPHMFSKSYFLTIHLMLTVICVLRIFYLIYDPYNVNGSFNIFLYEFLHSFPLSLLATTFAVLILFLLKRTLTNLEVSRPVFLVFFALLHILICFTLTTIESFGYFNKASLTICRPIFVLLVLALGVSYLYLYRIIKNVLAKRSQNLSEMCTQNISYASHITIAVALLFILLGLVELYALFFIPVDRFNGEIRHHWILWGFELSVRFIELSIITLLAIVVSLKMSQREKQTGTNGGGGGFPLFPCTTSDSSTDNIYPNNCNTNPNAMNYSRNEMIMDQMPAEEVLPPKNAFTNDSFEKKSTLERYHSDNSERGNWATASDRSSTLNLNNSHFERASMRNNNKNPTYYTKPKYDLEMGGGGGGGVVYQEKNIYSEPVDNHQYERTRHEFERGEQRTSSRNSSTSGRRSTGGRAGRKNHARAHMGGVQTLPGGGGAAAAATTQQQLDSMLVDEQGFVRFRHMQEEMMKAGGGSGRGRKSRREVEHFSDA